MVGNLTGTHLVKVMLSAFRDAHRILPRARHRAELRRQALKLRYWPEKNPTDHSGQLLDIDWCWIQSMKGSQVGELRIDDTIGDCDNLRIIFFVGPKIEGDPMKKIWILAAMQKKSNDFSKANITTFTARRAIVLERVYGHS